MNVRLLTCSHVDFFLERWATNYNGMCQLWNQPPEERRHDERLLQSQYRGARLSPWVSNIVFGAFFCLHVNHSFALLLQEKVAGGPPVNRTHSKQICLNVSYFVLQCFSNFGDRFMYEMSSFYMLFFFVLQARLKEITKLDQCLQTAAREGDPQAMQAVCAAQWTICLPLLQPKFRKYIRTPLLNAAIVLEEIQRCKRSIQSRLCIILKTGIFYFKSPYLFCLPDLTLGLWPRFPSLCNMCINAASLGAILTQCVCGDALSAPLRAGSDWRGEGGPWSFPDSPTESPAAGWWNTTRASVVSIASPAAQNHPRPNALPTRGQSCSAPAEGLTLRLTANLNTKSLKLINSAWIQHPWVSLGASSCLRVTFCPIGLCQVRDLHPKDETDIRPTLVSVGLLLAPDEFQMVLDADNVPESNDFSWQHFNSILAKCA